MNKRKIENKWNERRIKSMGNSPQVKGFEDEESSTRRRGETWRDGRRAARFVFANSTSNGSVYSRERGTARHKNLGLTIQGQIAPTLILTLVRLT